MAKVKWTIIRADGRIEEAPSWSNVNCNVGLNTACRQLYDTSYAANTKVFQYIAVSTGSGFTPAAADTTLNTEATANGLQRQTGSFSTGSNAVALWQQAATFIYTGLATVTVTGSALFDASSAGHMAHEALYSAQAVLNTNDQMANTWSGSLS